MYSHAQYSVGHIQFNVQHLEDSALVVVRGSDSCRDWLYNFQCWPVAYAGYRVHRGFFEGAQLKDPSGLLKSQGKNTQSAMRIEILDVTYIRKESKKIKQLINDAIKLEPSGKKSSPSAQPPWPEELMTAFRGDSEFKKAFEALTPGRQRSYLIHFSDARQSKTRENRIARSKAAIFAGKGFNER